jgi:hypothetical protein
MLLLRSAAEIKRDEDDPQKSGAKGKGNAEMGKPCV